MTSWRAGEAALSGWRWSREGPLAAVVLMAAFWVAWRALVWWDSGQAPTAVAMVLPVAAGLVAAAGLACWWRAESGRMAEAHPSRRAGMRDWFFHLACGLGVALVLGGLLAWLAAGPIGHVAAQVSGWLGVVPLEEVVEEMEDEPPQAAPVTDFWTERQIPRSLDGPPGGAPPLAVAFANRESFERAVDRVLYVRLAAHEVFDAAGEAWSARAVEPMELAPDDDGWVVDPDVGNAESIVSPFRYQVLTGAAMELVPRIPGTWRMRVGSGVRREGAAVWLAADPGPVVEGEAGAAAILDPLEPIVRADPNEGSGGLVGDMDPGPLWRERAREIAAAGPDGSTASLVAAIPDWLEQSSRYGDVFSTPEGESVLERFLAGDSPGTCEHFATAAVLLARAMGAEARVAYGYAGGEKSVEGKMVWFGEEDFHAWAEIRQEGGWRILEATPRGMGAHRSPSPMENDDPSADGFDTGSPGDAPAEPVRRGRDAWLPLVGGVVLLVAALLGSLLGRLRDSSSGGRSDRGGPGGPRSSPQPQFYQVFLRECSRLGFPRRRGKTAAEHLDDLPEDWSADPRIRDMIGWYYALRYEGVEDETVAARNERTEEQLGALFRERARQQTEAG